MPDFCAAYGCSNERSLKTRARGITFHLFPKTGKRRSQWELALRRDGFVASDRTLLCSEHFRSEDFDRTGQTVRLKDGVVPSIFNFPAHLQRTLKTSTRSTTTPRRAEDDLPMDLSRRVPQPDVGATGERSLSHKRQATDHLYSLPACPKAIKAKLEEASARVRKLQREKSNALKREKRTKMNMQALLEKLKEKNLINEELKDNLECYSDLPVHLLSRRGVEYTKAQREFALTLHLIGPKAYHYLRDTLHIHLPHPSSLQRWVSSLDARGHVTAQDDTESLPAVIDTSTSLSAVDLSSAAGGEDLPSPFADVPALVHDHRSCGQRSRGHFRICCATGSEEAVL